MKMREGEKEGAREREERKSDYVRDRTKQGMVVGGRETENRRRECKERGSEGERERGRERMRERSYRKKGKKCGGCREGEFVQQQNIRREES